LNSAWPLNFWILAWLAPHDGYIYLGNSLLRQLFFQCRKLEKLDFDPIFVMISMLDFEFKKCLPVLSISSTEKEKLHLPLALTGPWIMEAYMAVFLLTVSSDLFIVHSPDQYSTAFNWPPPFLLQRRTLSKIRLLLSVSSFVIWQCWEAQPLVPWWYSDCQQSFSPPETRNWSCAANACPLAALLKPLFDCKDACSGCHQPGLEVFSFSELKLCWDKLLVAALSWICGHASL